MKYILVIGDGMADVPLPELDGKTPLQYADIPALDRLAGTGVLGSVQTIPEGMPAGSDTAILSIFGYDPRDYYAGRAPLEAAATGIRLLPGDVAYRCNMISIEDGDMPFQKRKILSHSAGAISGAESDTLVLDLFDTPTFKEAADKAGVKVYPGSSFRHIAVCQETPLSPHTLTLTPPHDHLGEELGQYLPYGGENADVLKELIRLSYDFLNDHPVNRQRHAEGKLPANCIWFWAAGTAVELPDFFTKYGKTGSVISAVPLCQGIGTLIGLEKILVDGATGELHTNYEGKVDAVISALQDKDFVAVHIEAPDECTHNGDLKGKLQAIEWVDSRIVAPLVKRLRDSGTDYRMLVMSDHRTLSTTRGHDAGAVPFVLYDSRTGSKIDSQTKNSSKLNLSFCEADAAGGGFISAGTSMMNLLFEENGE